MSRPHPETISPTAHYTGYVWYAHGQSHEAFATRTGRLLYHTLRGPNVAAAAVGLPTLEGMLLARHRLIDLRLSRAIDAGQISQVIEVAAGLSPRGWRFRTRHGDRITYVEADLPGMLANKRRVLAALGGETAHHRTAEIDALVDDGPTSIDAIAASLDPGRGTAIITEGLVNYFPRTVVEQMWRRFSRALARFSHGIYFSDIVLGQDSRGALMNGFAFLLGMFVRGRIYTEFTDAADIEAALAAANLSAAILDPRDFSHELPDLELGGAGRVRVIEARPQSDSP